MAVAYSSLKPHNGKTSNNCRWFWMNCRQDNVVVHGWTMQRIKTIPICLPNEGDLSVTIKLQQLQLSQQIMSGSSMKSKWVVSKIPHWIIPKEYVQFVLAKISARSLLSILSNMTGWAVFIKLSYIAVPFALFTRSRPFCTSCTPL